jgi:hypothetical protein
MGEGSTHQSLEGSRLLVSGTLGLRISVIPMTSFRLLLQPIQFIVVRKPTPAAHATGVSRPSNSFPQGFAVRCSMVRAGGTADERT